LLSYYYLEISRLFGGLLKISDEIGSLVLLLQAGENHLGAWDIFLRILQVLPKSIFAPGDALGLVGVSVFVARSLASLTSKKTIKIGTNFVGASFFNGVIERIVEQKASCPWLGLQQECPPSL